MHRHRGHRPISNGSLSRFIGLTLLAVLISSATATLHPSKAQTIPPENTTAATPTTSLVPILATVTPATAVPTTAVPTTATSTAQTDSFPSTIPQIYISEFLANPAAVSDEVGEWLELFNGESVAVNLRGWQLRDLDTDHHTIGLDLIIGPGQYLILARSQDTSLNGGVPASYTYSGLTLANSSDELLLMSADGQEVDRVAWGDGHMLTPKAGASAQRMEMTSGSTWFTSSEPWPGSTGDFGSPGNAYQVAPTGTTTGTPPTQPAVTPTPAVTPATQWPIATVAALLVIDEVLYRGSDQEFVVLFNGSNETISLAGWAIGDEETPGSGEGFYALPERQLAPGTRFIIARDGAYFYSIWGTRADAEFDKTDEGTPDLSRLRHWGTGQWALNDSGDEIILLNPQGAVADAIVYGDGAYRGLAVTGALQAPKGYSLQRVPGPHFVDQGDQRRRFLYAPPKPFASVTLPTGTEPTAEPLSEATFAVWGSLGAVSTFSTEGTAPPDYLYHAAAAHGLNFLAIADPIPSVPWSTHLPLVSIPAWRYQGDDTTMIVYDSTPRLDITVSTLLAQAERQQIPLQWQDGNPIDSTALVALAADGIGAPDSLKTLYRTWRNQRDALMPAGNAGPPEPGHVAPAARYTGLIVQDVTQAGIQQALSKRRGWLTNRPGLRLTLAAQSSEQQRTWMGSTIEPANNITLIIDYGDRQHESAGLTLWQDDQPLQQLDLPTGNRSWEVTVAAVPDTFLYAVATQADGDFAITTPIYVRPVAANSIALNEVMPAPWADHNGDGAINTDDEYVELYNNSPQPRAITGWQLLDQRAVDGNGRGHTFGSGQIIPGYGYRILFRTESGISLNNEDEAVILRDADGKEIDRINWQKAPSNGASLSRIGDDGSWQLGNPTPGEVNRSYGDANVNGPGSRPTPPKRPDDGQDDDSDDQPAPVRLDPTHGQAGGPPASVAQSKLAGLDADVEFYAIVTAPPGIFNASIYVADPAPDPRNGPYAGLGINVYLYQAAYPQLQVGDRVRVRGTLQSFRGEMELQLHDAESIQKVESGSPLVPLVVNGAEIGESLEGRLVTFKGVVSGWQGDSIFLSDPAMPEADAVRVTVRSSTGWRRPYVNRGELWQVTGIVSQFAREAPWNGGYRVLVRYQEDLFEVVGSQE